MIGRGRRDLSLRWWPLFAKLSIGPTARDDQP
jgi:hypothetical protein